MASSSESQAIIVSRSQYKGDEGVASSSSGDGEIWSLIPTQGATVFFCMFLALVLKAGELDEIMESLRVSFDVVGPLLPPVILAVCGYLLLGVT
ncbi:hypothetical protein R1flu_018465 [Riccia fluitans]|uniref:Uncharacterized protein n=1 Tax=Riccia fluitans TaxID=41844 RepID=A0ABD1ZG42_9MARC